MEVTEESVVYKKSQLVESLTKKILKESIEEHHMGHSSPGKYDVDAYKIMDEDFDMEMSSMYVDCPECMGEGCSHCDDLGYHLSNASDISVPMFSSPFAEIVAICCTLSPTLTDCLSNSDTTTSTALSIPLLR